MSLRSGSIPMPMRNNGKKEAFSISRGGTKRVVDKEVRCDDIRLFSNVIGLIICSNAIVSYTGITPLQFLRIISITE